MTTVSANEVPKAVYEPYQAAAWLVGRHRTIQRLLDRCDAWTTDDGHTFPDVELVAQAIVAADQLGVEWKAYEDRHPAPADDAAYDRWEIAGPTIKDAEPAVVAAAIAYGPMSGGEKRMLRMLAVLAPATRVRFNLGDSDGVDQGYADDWRRLVAGR